MSNILLSNDNKPSSAITQSPHRFNKNISSSVLSEFVDDDIFSEFLQDSFDSKAFTSNAIEKHITKETKEKIQNGIQQLQKEINTQVTDHSTELLNQVNVINDLETMLQDVNLGVKHLEDSVTQIKKQLNIPYQHMKTTLDELTRIQKALDIMRKTKYFWDICCTLKKHLGINDKQGSEALKKTIIPTLRDLPTAARDLHKLEIIGKDPDLKGIDLIEKESEWILRVRQEVHSKASQMLVRGLETQNQIEVTNSLQVFSNLRTLAETVQQTIAIIEEKMNSSIRGVLDFSVLEQNSTKSQQNVEWKAVLWTRMEKLVDVLYQCCVQVWHLQRVLNKNGFILPEINIEKFGMTKQFWIRFTKTIEKEFNDAASSSSFIETSFVNDYSRLVHIFSEFIKRLQSNHEVKQGKPSGLDEEGIILLLSLKRFENEYCNNILDRIIEPFKRTFTSKGSHSLPSSEDITIVCKHIGVQLDIAQNTPQLISSTMDCITQVVQFYCNQVKENIIISDDAFQIGDKITNAQLRNSYLFNITYQFYDTLLNFSRKTSNKIQELLYNNSLALVAICNHILDSLYHRVTKLVDRIIISIHNTDYNISSDSISQNESSRFVQLLRKHIYNFCNVILSSYTSCSLIDKRSIQVTQRALIFFVRHASLVRPLSEGGKLKLAGDMAQLESAVTPLVNPKNVGEPYQALRNFRPFIFLENDKILTWDGLSKLQAVDILHHLFSRGCSDIVSPNKVLGWSISKYSTWLDSASPKDVLKVITKSLENYAKLVDSRGEKQYDQIYPLILELGPKLIQ